MFRLYTGIYTYTSLSLYIYIHIHIFMYLYDENKVKYIIVSPRISISICTSISTLLPLSSYLLMVFIYISLFSCCLQKEHIYLHFNEVWGAFILDSYAVLKIDRARRLLLLSCSQEAALQFSSKKG